MYSQFFGSYLLRRDAITPEQLTHAISQLSAAHIKLGTLAMHKGYMVASEVDEVCFLQTREDRRFGEIAIERGYLTEDQVRELLKTQIPDFSSLDNVWSMMVPFPMRNCKRWSWTTKPKMRCMTSI